MANETIGYNEDVVKTLSKKEFLENQKHHATHTDLGADYDAIVNKSKDKKTAEPEQKA